MGAREPEPLLNIPHVISEVVVPEGSDGNRTEKFHSQATTIENVSKKKCRLLQIGVCLKNLTDALKTSEKNFLKVYTGKRLYITVNKVYEATQADAQEDSIKKRLISMLSSDPTDV